MGSGKSQSGLTSENSKKKNVTMISCVAVSSALETFHTVKNLLKTEKGLQESLADKSGCKDTETSRAAYKGLDQVRN